MADTQPEEESVTKLKLVVNKETNKVIFAEAGKDFVDVLCSFLTLPLGTIVRLSEKDSEMGPVTIGCLNSLYHSVENLNEQCFWKATSKEMLLQPKNSSEDYCSTLKLNIDDTEFTKYFICSKFGGHYSYYFSTSTNEICPSCEYKCFTRSVAVKHFFNGFVNGDDATFVLTDDLIILPKSVGYVSFGLLQNSGIISTSSVEEMNVTITKEKVFIFSYLKWLFCCLLLPLCMPNFFIVYSLTHI